MKVGDWVITNNKVNMNKNIGIIGKIVKIYDKGSYDESARINVSKHLPKNHRLKVRSDGCVILYTCKLNKYIRPAKVFYKTK